MAGGQQINAGQGTILGGPSQAVSGSEAASAAGTAPSAMLVKLNSRKVGGGTATFQLAGQASTAVAGTILGGPGQVLVGAAINTGHGSVTTGRAKPAAGSAVVVSSGAVSAPAGNQSALLTDWLARSTAAGVIWAQLFETNADVNNYRFTNGVEWDPNPAPGTVGSYVRRNPTEGIMGNGALEMEQMDGANNNSLWWRPFNPAHAHYNRLNSGGDRGPGQPIYLGLWMKSNCGGNNGGSFTVDANGVVHPTGGRKAFSLTRTEESYLPQEMVCFDQYYNGAVMMYQGIGRNPSGGLDSYNPVTTAKPGADFDLQPGGTSFAPNYCSYHEVGAGNLSHCIQFDNGQWVWYQLTLIPGANQTDTTYMKLERWKSGMSEYQTIDERSGLYQEFYNLYPLAYNAVLLWIYETNRLSTGIAGLKQWYDGVILSTQPIAHPFYPPYSLPSSGQVVAIGTNSAYSITPASMSTGNYSYSLFNNFGGGDVSTDYSPGGAYLIPGTGGHEVPANVGVGIFDFTDATWKRLDPPASQGGTTFYRNNDYTVSETTGAPYYELNGSNGIPAPCHTVSSTLVVPKSVDGSTKGSMILVTRTAMCTTPQDSLSAYVVDMATGLWTRKSTNLASRGGRNGSAIWDAARNRYWHCGGTELSFNTVSYLDASDWTFKTTTPFTITTNQQEQGCLFMYQGLLIRYGLNETLVCFDPDTPSAGWFVLQQTGAKPGQGILNRWTYYPPNGKFYFRGSGQSDAVLYRLTPPASNPKTNTWVFDSVNLGSALPHQTLDGDPDPPNQADHYTCLMYVPSIRRLAWVPGGNASVYLIHPGA